MNIKLVLIIFISFFLGAFSIPKNLQKKVDKEIKSTFDVETFSMHLIGLPVVTIKELPAEFGKDNFFRIKSNNLDLGFAYMSKAPSKTDEFDYLVLFDNDLIIVKSKVLAYREDYGSEVGSKRWLKQLIGKSKEDILVYGDNIAAISGATISVRSMTNAINNVLASINILHKKQLL